MLVRHSIVPIDEVLPYVVMEYPPHGKDEVRVRPQRIYNGESVHMDSLRYQTFVKSGIICVACGLQASFFGLERSSNNGERHHLNLYGLKDGKEILFTKDHIQPKSWGGSHFVANMQTMCAPCNHAKGNGNEVIFERITQLKARYHRANSLRDKVEKERLLHKKLGKKVYQEGTPDGGEAYLKNKLRQQVLLNRHTHLLAIMKATKVERRSVRTKKYWTKQGVEISFEIGDAKPC